MACHARRKRETWSILPSPSDSFESHGSTAPSLSKKNRNSSKLEIPVLIKASTTTGSRLKFVPSAFRESSILEDSLGTKLKELAMLSRGSLPTRLSQSCPLGGVPLLLHNDYGRDESGDGGGRKTEGQTERRPRGHASAARSILPAPGSYYPPRRNSPLSKRPFQETALCFHAVLVKLATGNGSLHRQKGASCSYVSLCDKMKTGATASSRDPGGWCSIGTNLACWPAPGNRLHLRGTLRRLCQAPFALLAALAM